MTSAAPQPRTAAELTTALLALSDLPSGFALEPPSANADAPQASSKDPKCATFVQLSNAANAPGSLANAKVSFSAGQSGPLIGESIDALGSAADVAALQASYEAAISSCDKVTLTVPGGGTSTVTVRSVNPPKVGVRTVAVRMTADGGALDGLEVTMVTAGVSDTIMSLSFVAAVPDDIDGATGISVDKAMKALNLKGTATS